MHDDDLRAYACRPWGAAAALEQEHWARELARDPLATLVASQALWVHMRLINPDWPTEAQRQEDLAHHIALKRALDRADLAVELERILAAAKGGPAGPGLSGPGL